MLLISSGMRDRTVCFACSASEWTKEVDAVCREPLEAEMQHTVWLGGLVILAPSQPEIRTGESFQAFCSRISERVEAGEPLKAFQVVAFDVLSMTFTAGSRLVSL